MSVLSKLNISSAQRIDLPDMLAIESFGAGDWKYFLNGISGAVKPYIVKGFNVDEARNSIGNSSLSIVVADSMVFFPTSSTAPFYHGLPAGNALANPVSISLIDDVTNYIYLTLTTETVSADTRSFWDPDKDGGTGGEYSTEVNTQSILKVSLSIATGAFPNGSVPVAKVTMSGSAISEITDCRDLFYRLGTGGQTPDISNRYDFGGEGQRVENGTITEGGQTDPFVGGDKNITSLKDWMDAVMTRICEIGGSNYWFENTSSSSLGRLRKDINETSIKSKGAWLHSDFPVGKLEWTDDIQLKMVSDTRNIIIRKNNKTLNDEQVLYFNYRREEKPNTGENSISLNWIDGANYVGYAQSGAFSNTKKGDWIKKATASDTTYLRVEEFYENIDGTGSVSNAVDAKSIKLSENYVGDSAQTPGILTKGIYDVGDVEIRDRTSTDMEDLGGNFYWLALRSDNKNQIDTLTPNTLALTISENDGITAKCSATSHGLVDGQRIIISTGDYASADPYVVEVTGPNTFYIRTSVMTPGIANAYFAIIETKAYETEIGSIELESDTHGLVNDDFVYLEGLATPYTSYLATTAHKVTKISDTSFSIAITASQYAENASAVINGRNRVDIVRQVKMHVRTDMGATRINQGETKFVGAADTSTIQQFVGMDSANQSSPSYEIPDTYDVKNNSVNYNCDIDDSLRDRVSKLTAMIADKAQDKTIQLLKNGISNPRVSYNANTDISTLSFVNGITTDTLTIAIPSSANTNNIVLTSANVDLDTNTVVCFTIDRNNTKTITLANGVSIESCPLNENTFIFAYRLSGPEVWLWDGTKVDTIDSQREMPIKITLHDSVSTNRPTVSPATIDGVVVQTDDLVLFSALSSNKNRVYRASISAGTIAWAPYFCFNSDDGYNPSAGDVVVVKNGDAFEGCVGIYREIDSRWSFNHVTKYFNNDPAYSDYWEHSSINAFDLAANQNDTPIFTINATNSENWIIDYSISRNSQKEIGTILLSTDGVSASPVISVISSSLGVCGITFGAAFSAPDITLHYDSDANGVGILKYVCRRWSDGTGGPSGMANDYTPYVTPVGSGTSTQLTYWNSNKELTSNSKFKLDNAITPTSFDLNGLKITALNEGLTAVTVPANQANTVVITYDKTTYPFAVLEYSIIQGTVYKTGSCMIVTDGTNVNNSDNSVEIGGTSTITINTVISGSDVRIRCTNTHLTEAGSMKYSIRRWA